MLWSFQSWVMERPSDIGRVPSIMDYRSGSSWNFINSVECQTKFLLLRKSQHENAQACKLSTVATIINKIYQCNIAATIGILSSTYILGHFLKSRIFKSSKIWPISTRSSPIMGSSTFDVSWSSLCLRWISWHSLVFL